MTRDEMDAAIREACNIVDPLSVRAARRAAFIAGMRAAADIASEWEYGSTAKEQIHKAANELEKP